MGLMADKLEMKAWESEGGWNRHRPQDGRIIPGTETEVDDFNRKLALKREKVRIETLAKKRLDAAWELMFMVPPHWRTVDNRGLDHGLWASLRGTARSGLRTILRLSKENKALKAKLAKKEGQDA